MTRPDEGRLIASLGHYKGKLSFSFLFFFFSCDFEEKKSGEKRFCCFDRPSCNCWEAPSAKSDPGSIISRVFGNGAELISAAKGLGFSYDIQEDTLSLINFRLVVD